MPYGPENILNTYVQAGEQFYNGVKGAFNWWQGNKDSTLQIRDGQLQLVPPTSQKPPAPAEPAVKPPVVSPKPEGSSDRSERTNENGIKQSGMTLGGLNQFTQGFAGMEVADIKSAFQSEDLPTAYQNGSNSISSKPQTAYELQEGQSPSPLNSNLAGATDLKIEDSTYTVDSAAVPTTVPGTLGRTGDVQEGTSAKPDIAEEVRTIRMRRKGPRDEGSFRGFNIDRQNAEAQRPKTEAPDEAKMLQQRRRNTARGHLLDMSVNPIKATTRARASMGVGNNPDGTDVYNYGGELLQAKPGMERQALNAAMMGQNPAQFLDMPATPEVKPDTPANSEISMTAPIKDMSEEDQKKAAQVFAQGFVSDIAGKLKNK